MTVNEEIIEIMNSSSLVIWTETEQQLPEGHDKEYLVTLPDGRVEFALFADDDTWNLLVDGWYKEVFPIAWAEKPEGYRKSV